MRILHIVPGAADETNGIAVAARLIARSQSAATVADAADVPMRQICAADEVWVHSMWLPSVRRACRAVLRADKPLVRMPHGCLDPVRLRYHGWKKIWFAPFECALFRRAVRVVATCAAEADWIRAYEPRVRAVETLDLRQFFGRTESPERRARGDALHILYLGRRHPLKGVEFLELAARGLDGCEVRIVSDAVGEAKEAAWRWCDVLVLPTLSENFGLVVAEALSRGKRVITTDGAPAWANQLGVVYLRGFVAATPVERIRLLRAALAEIVAEDFHGQPEGRRRRGP